MSNITSDVKDIQTDALVHEYQLLRRLEKKKFFLLSDTRGYYQEILKQRAFFEELVLISPRLLVDKPAHEIREILLPAKAVLIDWSSQYARLLDTLRNYRSNKEIPILALCGKQETEHVAALVMGADETINRLFNPIMLYAKLLAYWRSIEENKESRNQSPLLLNGTRQSVKHANHSDNQDYFKIGPLTVNVAARILYVYGLPVQFTPIEFELIITFMKNAGVCLKREEIINQVWGIDYETGTNFLDVHIHAIRRKLKKAGLVPCIFTVRSIGYRFELLSHQEMAA